MNTNSLIPKIRQDLEKNIDDKTRSTTQHFFKEKIRFYGVKTAIVSKIGKEYYKLIKDRKKEEIFKLCDELWQSGYIEESIIACNWSYYINNWASCDTLCNHSLGEFLEKFPEFITELKGWAKSQNRWMRRASAVSLILPARKGKFLKDIFEISDILLTDKDDLVQKGYGWMLKAASQAHQKEVFEYVVEKKNMMPRTALRYAIEKMPQDLKKTAMEK
jgi:3-methyladenine DNA glycosylase AlkD